MYKDRDEQQLIARGARGMKTRMRGEGGGGQPPANPNLSYIYIKHSCMGSRLSYNSRRYKQLLKMKKREKETLY